MKIDQIGDVESWTTQIETWALQWHQTALRFQQVDPPEQRTCLGRATSGSPDVASRPLVTNGK